MATFKIKRFSLLDKSEIVEASEKFDNIILGANKNCLSKTTILGFGILSAIIYSVYKFFKSKLGSDKYKATEEEVKELLPEFPKEFEILRKIQKEVIRKCEYIFSCDSSMSFYINTLPSLLNLNSEEFITGWARETGKTGKRFAPIFVMYNGNMGFFYDFDIKSWFVIIGKEEYSIKTNIWDCLIQEFKRVSLLAKKNLADYPIVLKQALDYLDINIKLIKKYGKV